MGTLGKLLLGGFLLAWGVVPVIANAVLGAWSWFAATNSECLLATTMSVVGAWLVGMALVGD